MEDVTRADIEGFVLPFVQRLMRMSEQVPEELSAKLRLCDTMGFGISFPGVELNSIAGQTFTKALLEWNLPPIRFRRAGSPGFYLTWIRPSVFTTGIVTSWDDASERRELGNVGFQLDLRFGVLSRLDMTLSLGFAQAFSQGMKASNEFMISLKIL